ncbi:hypothetical protein, partial [Bacillus mobilis]|uniref:hypothetical protein n=1 Tax=Bacillus mobilis TaxID=2026190 RepID=UPI0022E661C1
LYPKLMGSNLFYKFLYVTYESSRENTKFNKKHKSHDTHTVAEYINIIGLSSFLRVFTALSRSPVTF